MMGASRALEREFRLTLEYMPLAKRVDGQRRPHIGSSFWWRGGPDPICQWHIRTLFGPLSRERDVDSPLYR
jgi:hypothetical protein